MCNKIINCLLNTKLYIDNNLNPKEKLKGTLSGYEYFFEGLRPSKIPYTIINSFCFFEITS
jgi:hypothetical protein